MQRLVERGTSHSDDLNKQMSQNTCPPSRIKLTSWCSFLSGTFLLFTFTAIEFVVDYFVTIILGLNRRKVKYQSN